MVSRRFVFAAAFALGICAGAASAANDPVAPEPVPAAAPVSPASAAVR